MSRRAVLLIDLQKEWFELDGLQHDYKPTNARTLLPSVKRLVGWAHANDVPVIWARLTFRPGHFDAVRDSISRRRGSLVEGTRGAELVDGLGREDRDVIVVKRRPSAFFRTDLDIVLRGLGVEQLLIGGMATNWAVESTVREGHSHDYEIVVVREAVGSSSATLHRASLRSMAAVYAKVVSLNDVLSGATFPE